jgi:hypothetical protein
MYGAVRRRLRADGHVRGTRVLTDLTRCRDAERLAMTQQRILARSAPMAGPPSVQRCSVRLILHRV